MARTLDAETSLLAELVADAGRVAVDEIGTSVQGRPIRLVRIGHPTPPAADDRAMVLHVGLQHGNETAGRDALLDWIEHLATTADTDQVNFLSTYGLLVIPTLNPDGFALGQRGNAHGVDVNRDHIQLSTPEAQALARVMGRARPAIIVDHHESTLELNDGGDIAFAFTNNPATDAGLVTHAQDLVTAMKARAASEAWSTADREPTGIEDRLSHASGLRHAAGVLVETTGLGQDAQPEQDRIDQHRAMAEATMAYGLANDVIAEADDAAARKTAEGAAGTTPFQLRVTVLDPPPLGYRLTGLVPHVHLETFGIAAPAGVVSMAQPAQPVIPHLFDIAPPAAVSVARRLFDLNPPPAPPATVQQFAAVVSGSHDAVFEAILVDGFQTGPEPTGIPLPIIDGDVQFDATADVFATFSLTTTGVDELTGRPWFPRRGRDLLAPFGNEVFLRRGVHLGDQILWSALGYFRIESVEQDGNADAPIRLAGRDRMGGIIDARPLQPQEFPPTAAVGTVVAQLVGEAHPLAGVVFDDDTPFATLGRTLVVEDDRYAALREVADAFGKIMFWDGDGLLRLEMAPDESSPVWEVRAGRGGVLITSARRMTREGVHNGVVAMGEAGETDAPPVRGVAVDLGPNSPTNWNGRFGRVPRFYSSPLIRTTAQATSAARAILSRSLGAPYSADFAAVPNPALRPWHPVRVTHSDGNREVHVIETLTIPLVADAEMPATTRQKTTVVIGGLA